MGAAEFTVEVFQNEYLPDGARQVNAIVTVTSVGATAEESVDAAGAAEIIIVDRSGSMAARTKMDQARAATAAAIDVIRDGAAFAVVAGDLRAHPVYPADGTLAIADADTRTAAKAAVARLRK